MTRAARSLVFLALAACIATPRVDAQPRRPNILLIVSDDIGYADFGVHGSREIPTPNIDALAREGIRFTDAYVSGPYCSPTRAGLMTGRYQQRFGHEFNIEPGQERLGLPLTQRTLADRLKAAGYTTAALGKWHLGMAPQFHPMRRGFDEFFGFLAGGHSYFDVGTGATAVLDGTTPATPFGYLTDALAARAAAYIGRHAAEPFFLYVAFNAAHLPPHAPEKYLSRFANIQDQQRRTYAAMISAMDDGVGTILRAVRDHKLDRDTLVIFFNDNGGPTMASTAVNGSSNAPLRGSKRTTWEGGIRVPFIVRWPGRLPAGRVDHRPIIQLDVAPTALAAARVETEKPSAFDGVNLLPFVTGSAQGSPHDALFWRLGGMMAIRMGDWKLVKSREGPFVDVDPGALTDLTGAELFNLANDVGETKNLASSQPERVRDLSSRWRKWNAELAAPAWDPPGRGRQSGRGVAAR
ncbi:MAG: sulfatase-like hydrolase/transferase [Vicinamibacterales bacterium]